MQQFDVAIVGAGILGLATGMLLAQRYPRTKILTLEKEDQIAQHQTGHNSGVIHSGIYYKPGSLKAKNCTAGRAALIEFCDAHGIPYELCGKVIVATSAEELPRLEELKRRGDANGVPGLQMIGPERLREIEPNAYGIKALYAPGTGIIDFTKVAHAYAGELQRLGGQILTAHRVVAIASADGALRIQTSKGEFTAKYLINCTGLHVDRTARMMGRQANPTAGAAPRIIPFRGEYYTLVADRRSLVKGLIFRSRTQDFRSSEYTSPRELTAVSRPGRETRCSAFAREGYRKGIWDRQDLWEICSYKGFWLMAFKYWKMGLGEFYRSFSKRAFVKALQRLVPAIESTDLSPGGAGVRAQALSATGALLDDFVLTRSGNSIHVLNAPSPGATASLAIAGTIVDMASEAFAVGS